MTTPPKPSRGIGDRWLAGERVAGIQFALHDRVEVVLGRHTGQLGAIALLLEGPPDPLYVVTLGGGGRDIRVRQSALRHAS